MKKIFFLTLTFCLSFELIAQDAHSIVAPVVKERIIKTDFFAPLTGNLAFGYEQTLLNSITFDGAIGIIGIGVIENDQHPAGIFIKGGTRFYFTPDYLLDGMKRFNDFQGTYFKPEIIYSGFGFDYYQYNYPYGSNQVRGSNHSFSLMLNLGKQWVLADVLSVDFYGGVGYGWSVVDAPNGNNNYLESDDVPYKYSHMQPSNQLPIAFAAGFNLGVLMK